MIEHSFVLSRSFLQGNQLAASAFGARRNIWCTLVRAVACTKYTKFGATTAQIFQDFLRSRFQRSRVFTLSLSQAAPKTTRELVSLALPRLKPTEIERVWRKRMEKQKTEGPRQESSPRLHRTDVLGEKPRVLYGTRYQREDSGNPGFHEISREVRNSVPTRSFWEPRFP